MHKLIEYICGELEELERKSEKDGLSMAEIQYGDTLAHFKKNLLKSEEMMDEEGYSMAGNRQLRRGDMSMRGGNSYGRSYARGRGRNARRDSMGRYSRDDGYSMASEDMISELHELMEDAPDEKTRQEFHRFIQKIENMM